MARMKEEMAAQLAAVRSLRAADQCVSRFVRCRALWRLRPCPSPLTSYSSAAETTANTGSKRCGSWSSAPLLKSLSQTMHYALCTMHYALCTMHYALCTMDYGLWTNLMGSCELTASCVASCVASLVARVGSSQPLRSVPSLGIGHEQRAARRCVSGAFKMVATAQQFLGSIRHLFNFRGDTW